MKKFIYKIIPVLIIAVLSSCTQDLDTEGISRVTIFPTMELVGDETVIVNIGSAYSDEGVIAKAGEDEIPVEVSYLGEYYGKKTVDTSVPDMYNVTYSAANSDGIKLNSTLRTIWVAKTGDLVNSIEGLYISNVQRAPSFTQGDEKNMKYVIISKKGDNTYEISHAIGGYYDYGRAYGSGYAARGAIITANNIVTNDFSISQAEFPIWGNVVDITDFTVDAGAKTISFTGNGDFGNGTFKVQLTQVQF